jgi:hypothetical protein
LNLQIHNNIATRELGITDALKFEYCKFENYHFTVTVAKKKELMSDFFCDALEDKIVYMYHCRVGLFVLHPVADLHFLSVFNLGA